MCSSSSSSQVGPASSTHQLCVLGHATFCTLVYICGNGLTLVTLSESLGLRAQDIVSSQRLPAAPLAQHLLSCYQAAFQLLTGPWKSCLLLPRTETTVGSLIQSRLNNTLARLGWELEAPPLIKSCSGRFCSSSLSHFPEEKGGDEETAGLRLSLSPQ